MSIDQSLELPGLSIPAVIVGGLPVAVIDREQSARVMTRAALARRGSGQAPLFVTSANGQVISLCARDPGVREIYLSADLVHADGMPLVFASRAMSRSGLPERVATTDLFHDVAAAAQAQGASFYLLGASAGVIETAVHNVQQRYPRLKVAGFRHGYFGPGEEDAVIAAVNAARPDILWIGLGVPAEQRFVYRNRGRLTGVGLIKTSGGLFDFLAEKNPRAPAWMQAVGLEWLYRTMQEPRRLVMRYLTTNPHALYLLLTRTSDGY